MALLTLQMLFGVAAGAMLLRAGDRAHLPSRSTAGRGAMGIADESAKQEHRDYCRCRSCPGDSSCCCSPGESAPGALALAAACEGPDDIGLRLMSPQPALLPSSVAVLPDVSAAVAYASAAGVNPGTLRVRPLVQPPRPL